MSGIIGTYSGHTENPELYATFKPKIAAYKKKLEEGVLPEYKIPDSAAKVPPGTDVRDIPLKYLTASERKITDMSATQLVHKIAKGELTSVEVFKAFAKRATAAKQLTNCALELFILEGLERAKKLDEYFKKTGKTVGPLHGLPISLKEHYNYKGKVTHSGYISLIDNVVDNWSVSLKVLRDAGAVYYVRTSEPQSLMHMCSFNNIIGYATNPNNTKLSPGGSSSGEGVMGAMHGSAMGAASDIGGSIRLPAAFNGDWGLRPTQKRTSMRNIDSAGEGVQEGVCSVLGPIAHCGEDLNLFMSAMAAGKPWEQDATVIPLPWREVPLPEPSKLKVAVIYDDGVCKPTPPILRGLKYSVEKLKKSGVEVVEWEPIAVGDLISAIGSMYNADGDKGQENLLAASGEPVVPLTKFALAMGCGDKGVSTCEYQKLAGIRDKYRNIYQDKMNSEKIDFILSPTYVNVAPKLGTAHYGGYTQVWNILDHPCVIFPTGLRCNPKLDPVDKNYRTRNEVEKYEYRLYDNAEDFENAPICLQLIGRRWFDEEVVQAARSLEKIISD